MTRIVVPYCLLRPSAREARFTPSPGAVKLMRSGEPKWPRIYIEGELGIRHEDVITITETGAENLTRWSGSPEELAVV